jgi:hypothetical protein
MKMIKEKRLLLETIMIDNCTQFEFELARGNLAANPKIKDSHVAASWLVFHYVNKKFDYSFSEGLDDKSIEYVITKIYQKEGLKWKE